MVSYDFVFVNLIFCFKISQFFKLRKLSMNRGFSFFSKLTLLLHLLFFFLSFFHLFIFWLLFQVPSVVKVINNVPNILTSINFLSMHYSIQTALLSQFHHSLSIVMEFPWKHILIVNFNQLDTIVNFVRIFDIRQIRILKKASKCFCSFWS